MPDLLLLFTCLVICATGLISKKFWDAMRLLLTTAKKCYPPFFGINSKLGVMKTAPLITLFALLVMTASQVAANEGNMNPYQEKVSNRRNSEASILWKTMQNDGFTSSSIVALDFVYFSDKKEDAERLEKVLSENYTVGLNPDADSGYWLVKGSTRPYGKQLTAEQWHGWIDYMIFVGFQNNCVFSTWAVYEPKSKKTWSSETIETE